MSQETIETTASILMIVATSTIFALDSEQRINSLLFLAEQLLTFTENKIMILLIITVMVSIIGCFMETIAAITILVPVLLPVAVQIGIDPVHFGIILILNLMLGLLTPPVGMVLYVLQKCLKRPLSDA